MPTQLPAAPIVVAPRETGIIVDTVAQLLTNALTDAGIVGIDESIEQPILNRAMTQANWLLAQWTRKRFMAYRIHDFSFVTTGQMAYTVGQGGDINMNPRPDRLEYAFLRFLTSTTPVDIPVEVVPSRENYAQIPIKNIGTIAWRIFYDPEWPVGRLYPWPVPQGGGLYEIHVGFKVPLPRFNSLSQPINLPPEYEAALNWCLARRFRASYQMPPDQTIDSLARDALNSIRLANMQVGVMSMPKALRSRNRAYDYRGDSQ